MNNKQLEYSSCGPYLTFVLLMSHSKFDIRVTEAIGVHRLEVMGLNETDANYASPQLSLPVNV